MTCANVGVRFQTSADVAQQRCTHRLARSTVRACAMTANMVCLQSSNPSASSTSHAPITVLCIAYSDAAPRAVGKPAISETTNRVDRDTHTVSLTLEPPAGCTRTFTTLPSSDSTRPREPHASRMRTSPAPVASSISGTSAVCGVGGARDVSNRNQCGSVRLPHTRNLSGQCTGPSTGPSTGPGTSTRAANGCWWHLPRCGAIRAQDDHESSQGQRSRSGFLHTTALAG